jgi:hypothetical protein
MKSLNDISDLINELDFHGEIANRFILIVNNDDSELLDIIFNRIYRIYKGKKISINSSKGLYKKVCNIKNKFIKINIDLDKVQFTSSHSRKYSELRELRMKASENNSALLFKYEKREKLDSQSQIMWYYRWSSYFDLILVIDDKKLKIINSRYTSDTDEFDITQAIRSYKLNKLKQRTF